MPQDAWGIDAVYQDAAGKEQQVSLESVEAIRSVIGHPPKGRKGRTLIGRRRCRSRSMRSKQRRSRAAWPRS